jgi:hypothetical protein
MLLASKWLHSSSLGFDVIRASLQRYIVTDVPTVLPLSTTSCSFDADLLNMSQHVKASRRWHMVPMSAPWSSLLTFLDRREVVRWAFSLLYASQPTRNELRSNLSRRLTYPTNTSLLLEKLRHNPCLFTSTHHQLNNIHWDTDSERTTTDDLFFPSASSQT